MCVRKCVRRGFVNCACVVGGCGHIFDLRCAIALFILVHRGADEYVIHIYVRLHTILIYGLHIRLPPINQDQKYRCIVYTILIYGLHILLPPYQLGSKVPLMST